MSDLAYATLCMLLKNDLFSMLELAQKRHKNGGVLPMTRENKRFIISMPIIMKFFLEFEMLLVKHLLGGNTAA